jgi:hypothetical protein
VVLSELPLSSVLTPLSRFLGPLVLSYGVEALEQVRQRACSRYASKCHYSNALRGAMAECPQAAFMVLGAAASMDVAWLARVGQLCMQNRGDQGAAKCARARRAGKEVAVCALALCFL